MPLNVNNPGIFGTLAPASPAGPSPVLPSAPTGPVDPAIFDMANMGPEYQEALDKAKIGLMLLPDTIFYTTILFSMKQYWEPRVPTAATDGLHLYLNPVWFLDLDPKQRIGLLAHEILHVALRHMTRMGSRDPRVWNHAADYVINALLKKAGYTLPDGGLFDDSYLNMDTEAAYDKLYSEPGKGSNVSNSMGGDIFAPGSGSAGGGTPKQKAAVADAKITESLVKATMQTKMAGDAGSIPGGIEMDLEAVLNPKLPWQVILANYMTDFARDDYSMQRPNRRFFPDWLLPGAFSEHIGNLAIAVDTSGSVSDYEFSFFLSEMESIREMLGPETLTVIDFDTSIKAKHVLDENTPLSSIQFHGRGGTDVTDLMKWCQKKQPEILIVFTDGDFYPPDKVPDTPVLWIIHDNPRFKEPCGTTIHYDMPD